MKHTAIAWLLGATVLAGVALAAGPANAGFVATYAGNDCAGEFGIPFPNCKIPADVDPDQSPVIIKLGFDGESDEINSGLFPTIDGSEFAIVLDDAEGTTGSWTYTPGPGDPVITFFVAKGGDSFNLFSVDDLTPPQTGSWFTPDNPGGNPSGLSHLTFYDSTGNGNGIPEPATLALLGVGLIGLGLARRHFRR